VRDSVSLGLGATWADAPRTITWKYASEWAFASARSAGSTFDEPLFESAISGVVAHKSAAARAPTTQRAISLDLTRNTLRDLPWSSTVLYRAA
jgi:hypothetical protein